MCSGTMSLRKTKTEVVSVAYLNRSRSDTDSVFPTQTPAAALQTAASASLIPFTINCFRVPANHIVLST